MFSESTIRYRQGETAVQTLKTAAIVVLLMTVLYGAYVSMTTPPDPLPQGVESMLVESGLDEFPDDFADFGIDSGTPEGILADPSNTTPTDIGDQLASGAQNLNSAARNVTQNATNEMNSSLNFGAVDQTFADAAPDAGTSGTNNNFGESFSLSDLGDPRGATSQASRLPDVGSSPNLAIQLDPNQDYPSTGSRFSLPDPAVAAQASASSPAASSATVPSRNLPTQSLPTQGRTSSDLAASGLTNAIATADRQYSSDRRREALATLSLFYETPNLTSEQREQLLIRLDPLAREVIYSPDHLLEQPHRVTGNETLMDVAQKYDVPWQLLANINGIDDPVTVLPGTDLKVLRGPFRADVDLNNQELTLFLGDLYAGRFPIGIGSDPTPRAGTYTIQEKNSAKTYYDMSGNPVPPGNPRNPYGAMWIDLGSGISLHGSPIADRATDEGCISVAGNYSRDVFGILSEGSSVTIR